MIYPVMFPPCRPGAVVGVVKYGTSDLLEAWHDDGQTIAACNPVHADSDGLFPNLYVGEPFQLKMRWGG